MRILIISHGHPALQIGGGEILAHGLFEAMQGQGGDVHFLACAMPRQLPEGTRIGIAPYGESGREWVFNIPPYNYFWGNPNDASLLQGDFAHFVLRLAPDVIHFHHFFHIGAAAFQIARQTLPRARIYLTLHEFMAICLHDGQMVKTGRGGLCDRAGAANCHQCYPDIPPARFEERETRLKAYFSHVDRFLCPSRFLLERYRQWGLPANKLHYLQNGHQCEPQLTGSLSKRELRNRFGFFGQFTPYKGIEVLLEAIEILSRQGAHPFEVHLHGTFGMQLPEYRERLFSRIASNPNLVFQGPYQHSEVLAKMAEVDWVILPSIWWENSPLTIEEALAAKRPVICSDIGGMREKVRHNRDGLHFKVGDAADLARTMALCLDRPQLWQCLIGKMRNARSMKECAREHLDLFTRAGGVNDDKQRIKVTSVMKKHALKAYALGGFAILHWTVAEQRPPRFSVFIDGQEIPKPYQGIGMSDPRQCLIMVYPVAGIPSASVIELRDEQGKAFGRCNCKTSLPVMDAAVLASFDESDQAKVSKGLLEMAARTFVDISPLQNFQHALQISSSAECAAWLPDGRLYLRVVLGNNLEGIEQNLVIHHLTPKGRLLLQEVVGTIEANWLHLLISVKRESIQPDDIFVLQSDALKVYLPVRMGKVQRPKSNQALCAKFAGNREALNDFIARGNPMHVPPEILQIGIDAIIHFPGLGVLVSGWKIDSANNVVELALVSADGVRLGFDESDNIPSVRSEKIADLRRRGIDLQSSAIGINYFLTQWPWKANDEPISLEVVLVGGTKSHASVPSSRITTFGAKTLFSPQGAFILAEHLSRRNLTLPERLSRSLQSESGKWLEPSLLELPCAQKPENAFHLAVESFYLVAGHSLYLIGWKIDPSSQLKRMALCSTSGKSIDITGQVHEAPRADVYGHFKGKGLPLISDRLGFHVWLPDLQIDEYEVFYLQATLRTGESYRLPIRSNTVSPGNVLQVVKKLLLSVDEKAPSFREHIDTCVGPAVREMWKLRPTPKVKPEIHVFGEVPAKPLVSIIVPIYGRIDLLTHQLSLFAEDPDFKKNELIFVLDDPAQRQDFLSLCKQAFDLFDVPFKTIDADINQGYAPANNLGAGVARGKYLLLLNSDVMPKEAGWLSKLVKYYGKLDKPGAIAPTLLFPDESIQHAGIAFERYEAWGNMWINDHPGKGEHLEGGVPGSLVPRQVAAVTGACLLVESRRYNQLGGLTEDYILGDFEDSDFCLKAIEAGYKNYYVSDVELYHLERQSQSMVGDMQWRTRLSLYNCWLQNSRWDILIAQLAIKQ